MDNLPTHKIKPFHNLISEIGSKNQTVNNSPQYSILLGAGCSAPTIPLGSDLIKIFKQKAYCRWGKEALLFKKDNSISEEEFVSQRPKEFQDFIDERESLFSSENEFEKDESLATLPLKIKSSADSTKIWEEYKEKVFIESLYGKWFSAYSGSAEERQELIEDIIQKHKPPVEYIILSFLIQSRLFQTVFTTNFDDFINEALLNYTTLKPRVVSHNEPLTFKKFISQRPTIIKLHGDYLFEDIKNLKEEIGELAPDMFNKFSKALNLFDLIVVGYNGADASVMNAIEKIKTQDRDFTLYWCVREGDTIHWRVKHLIENYKNCYIVKIKSFNTLVLELWNSYLAGDFVIPDFAKQAEERKHIISNYLNQTVQEAKIEKTVSEKTISNLEISLDHLLPDNTFEKVRVTTDNAKRFEILKTYSIDKIGKAVRMLFDTDRVAAKSLFKKLYDHNIFKEKVIAAPIQHIGNAFSNFKEVDHALTEKIYIDIEEDIFIQKLRAASPGIYNSAVGELQPINPEKTRSIAYKVQVFQKVDYDKLNLRQIIMLLSDVNRSDSFELLESKPDEFFVQKILKEKLSDLGFALSRISMISPTRAKAIFHSVPNDFIIEKIKENNLERIGQNLSVFEKVGPSKTRTILKAIEADILKEKIQQSNLRDFASSLKEFVLFDKFAPKRFYQSVPDNELAQKFIPASFTEICNALVKLDKVDTVRTNKILNKIETAYLTKKLSAEKKTFEGTGSSLLNLKILSQTKAKTVFSNSNFKEQLSDIAKDSEKSGEQSFFHYISTYLELDYEIGKNLISKINRKFLIEILKWKNLGLYTSKLPALLKAFDELGFQEEGTALSKVMCVSKQLIHSKLGHTEATQTILLINKFVVCK
ncbi:MAG: SIR2 family protein [Vicingaceae bacterium]|nr:MAG: SIR2 family protein [Vicingaceae bacterium]